ncbi:MAG TPA: ABC transporter permease [Pyrinomonadaceae bacterium]|nr:ABC transporter permease [Pyrinomonadaceae bacterium]
MSLRVDENVSAVAQPDFAPPSSNDPANQSNVLHVTPDKPVVVIKPTKAWAAIDFRELWAHRELLYFLVWRDVKVRYKQTLLGVAWVIVQPLFTALIFTIFFGILARVPSEGIPYTVFAFAGLLPWIFFSNAVAQSSNSLVGSAHLITKVYFPRIIIPAAAVAAGLLDFAISFVVLGALMVYYGVSLTWGFLAIPALLLLLTLFAAGVGMWLSAMNVKYRDVRHLLPFVLQVWMFASPVIYPPTFVPEKWRWILSLNPMTGIIDGFRAAIFGEKPFDRLSLALSVLMTVVILVSGAFAFKRMEKSFADVV